jgi:SF-assemblin/beta giardin
VNTLLVHQVSCSTQCLVCIYRAVRSLYAYCELACCQQHRLSRYAILLIMTIVPITHQLLTDCTHHCHCTYTHSFEATFDEERRSRLEREGGILKQLADHEVLVDRDMESERGSREATTADLRRVLEEHIRSRNKGDEKFQAMVAEELAALRNAVQSEQITRERDDNEIVDALNRYTTKLQTSLRIINSTET